MHKEIDLNKILKSNPHINKEDLKKNYSLAKELHKIGMQPHTYQLALPFTHHIAMTSEGDKPDPRTINLSASYHQKYS